MRRASLVAPLLLIGLGALFLARNLYPDLPLTQYVARYWPYVLIFWGALRIAEVCYWAASSKPLPASGVSGGEWALVVFICLIGMGMHAAQGVRWWPERIPWAGINVIGERFDYPVNAEKPSSKTPHIVVEDFRGDLQITGADADMVRVAGRKSIRALDRDGAERADQNSAFEIEGDASQMTLHLREGGAIGGRISSSLELTVPKGANIEAKRRDGDVRIGGIDGAVNVSGRANDVDLHDIGGPVSLEGTYTGDIQFKNLAKGVRFKGARTDLSAAAVPGQIHIDPGDMSADGITGPARLSSRSRDVRIRDFRNSLEVELDRGDLHLEPVEVPLSHVQATVRSGDVNFVLPENAGFSIKATTKNGEISNGLGAGFKIDSDRRRQTLEGSAGAGPEIAVDVERGGISVSRGSSKPPAGKSPGPTGKSPAKDTPQPLETINQ